MNIYHEFLHESGKAALKEDQWSPLHAGLYTQEGRPVFKNGEMGHVSLEWSAALDPYEQAYFELQDFLLNVDQSHG